MSLKLPPQHFVTHSDKMNDLFKITPPRWQIRCQLLIHDPNKQAKKQGSNGHGLIIVCMSTGGGSRGSPCLVQAPSKLTMLRWGPRWLMIFSSDIRAWVSLRRAVAGRDEREREREREREWTGPYSDSLPNFLMTCWLKVKPTWQPHWSSAAPQLSLYSYVCSFGVSVLRARGLHCGLHMD